VFRGPIAERRNDWRSGKMASRWPRRAPTLEIASATDGALGSCVARRCKQVSLGPIRPYSPHGAKRVPSRWRKTVRGETAECLVGFPLHQVPELGRKFNACQPRGATVLFHSLKAQVEGLSVVRSKYAVSLKLVSYRTASCAMQRAGAMVLVKVMRIPSFGRRMTIGRASILWPGASWKSYFLSRSLKIIRICSIA
jgi:hypothetical protein